MSDLETCQVCIETFNKKTHFKVECFNCDFVACRKCVRQFVLSDTNMEAFCMNCKIPWNDEFVGKQLLNSFFLKDYRTHIQNMAVQQQISLLPASQPEAERITAINNMNKEMKILNNTIADLVKDVFIKTKEIKEQYVISVIDKIKLFINEQYDLEKLKPKTERKTKKQLNAQYMKTKTTILNQNASEIIDILTKTDIYIQQQKVVEKRDTLYKELVNKVKDKTKIVYERPCGNSDCNGMIASNKNLCGLCNYITCQKCLIAHKKEDNHECAQEDIDTAKLIKKDTKYCPKCNFGITKISGCDVMFCTQCTTSFHWRTLEIITKNIHNPHYLEYLKNNGTNQQHENMINNCTANPTITNFDMNRFRSIYRFCANIELFKEYKEYANIGMQIVYKLLHYNHLVEDFQNEIDRFENLNVNARVNLLLNKINKTEFTKIVKNNMIQSKFKQQCKQIVQTIVTVGIDLFFHYSNNEMMAFNNIIRTITDRYNFRELNNKTIEFFNQFFAISTLNEMKTKITEINIELNKVIEHCKSESLKLSKLYNLKKGIYLINIQTPF